MRIDLSRQSIAMIHTGNVATIFFFFFFFSLFCFSNSFTVDICFLKGAEFKACFPLLFIYFFFMFKFKGK